MVTVDGIDLDLLLEDNARLTKRVAELEDNQETIVKFLRARFPKYANQLKKLLQENNVPKKSSKPVTVLGQEDDGLTTREAITRCFSTRSTNVDPILAKVVIRGSQDKPAVSANLRG